jgi:hypothetical protein
MKTTFLSTSLFSILLFTGCINQQSVSNEAIYKPGFKFQAGINTGGIVENTDFAQIPNTEADAYTGATNIGFNMGAKVYFPIRRNGFETGVEYINSSQIFTYHDDANGYDGRRELKTSQLMIPLTYNIGFFRKKFEEGLFTFKLGYLVQFNFVDVNDEPGNLPECEIENFSSGITAGLATSPFHFKNGSRLGFYIDMYRGSMIYEDFYNQKEFEMPGTSFIKYGLSYDFQ